MSEKHTPGPWLTSYDGHGGICVDDAQGRQVGFVSARTEQKANARLIAAAPELLEALEELMYARTDKAERMARAAIAKATGGPR